jgi:hypothetical protein
VCAGQMQSAEVVQVINSGSGGGGGGVAQAAVRTRVPTNAHKKLPFRLGGGLLCTSSPLM